MENQDKVLRVSHDRVIRLPFPRLVDPDTGEIRLEPGDDNVIFMTVIDHQGGSTTTAKLAPDSARELVRELIAWLSFRHEVECNCPQKDFNDGWHTRDCAKRQPRI